MRNRIWPELPDSEHQQFLEELYGTLCQHFVCLGIRLEAIDDEGNPMHEQKAYSISCFVVVINNQWCLITAGHIISLVSSEANKQQYRMIHSFLVCHFGDRETDKRLMPFDYQAAQKHSVDDTSLGLDYAFIRLNDNDVLTLRANNIIPIALDDWIARSFNAYWMLGLPTEVSRRLNKLHGTNDDWARKLAAVIVSVEAIKDESQTPFTVLIQQPKFPGFIGRITAGIDFGIDGMSGGPIFGLVAGSDDKLRYTVVAIQSKCDKYNMNIIGCDMAVVVNELRNFLNA